MAHRAKVWIYAVESVGCPKVTDFELKTQELPALEDGKFLAEAMYFGMNAGMRAYQKKFPLGSVIFGAQIAKIIESKNDDFQVGKIVYGVFGWRSLAVVDPKAFAANNLYILPDFGNLPASLGIGVLGVSGNTAYFGLLDICEPKEGETVVVTSAAGSVGALVGQIAKIKGCHVVGFAGTDEKCKWLENELGFDKAINYKTPNVGKALKEAAPKGVDCFFDNSGGNLSVTIIRQMNQNGRIAVCGAVSEYNSTEDVKIASPFSNIILQQLTLEGFIVYRYIDRWMEGIEQIFKWIQEGKVKYHETVTEGFENMPQALIDCLNGSNFGKAVVKV